jgi:hypothetical protein
MARYCKSCGNKIPRNYKSEDGRTKKTQKNRKQCYNCSPLKSKPNNKDHPHEHPKPKHTKEHKEHKSERRRRKEELVKLLGGQCVKCGYHKSPGALSFHHKNPKKKCFDISNNGNMMQDWGLVKHEALKCELLCLNCHAELHTK